MNAHVHPLMAAVLHSVATAPMQAREIQRGAYVAMLKRCNFNDPAVVRDLRMVQRDVDADGSLWNQHAPEACRIDRRM